jgi:hypothetical protein
LSIDDEFEIVLLGIQDLL